ncbi:MAG: hypothetical protein LBB40_03705 [Holophagales bacterium]|jgi:hypothetical protein|nr:hypothetical protein [Holophagales bacterium]
MLARLSKILSILLKIQLLSISVLAFAQSEPGQWINELYLVEIFPEGSAVSRTFVFVDEKDNICLKIMNVGKSTDFPVAYTHRLYSFSSYWHNDALYSLASGLDEKNQNGSLFKRWTFAKWQDDKWHFLGDYKTGTKQILTAIPCDNDRFIVISNKTDLTNDNRSERSPFHIMSATSDKKEIRLNSSIDYGQDDLKNYMSHPNFFKLASLSYIIMTDKYATLLNRKTGLYWIFSLEKASLVKSGNIFKSVTPEMIAKGGFPDPILCVNPEKNGTILIAAQEERFFINETGDATEELNKMLEDNPFMPLEDAHKIYGRRLKELADINPFIIWYRIYPENGKVERLIEPPEGGTDLRDGGKNDRWRPMPDGSVQMGWNTYNLENSYKTGQSNNTKAESKKETNESAPPNSKL